MIYRSCSKLFERTFEFCHDLYYSKVIGWGRSGKGHGEGPSVGENPQKHLVKGFLHYYPIPLIWLKHGKTNNFINHPPVISMFISSINVTIPNIPIIFP